MLHDGISKLFLGWSGGSVVVAKLSVPGRPLLILIIVWQE